MIKWLTFEVITLAQINIDKNKIQSESQKQGKTQEEYAEELAMNKAKSQKKKK
jgi:hypothetical protein